MNKYKKILVIICLIMSCFTMSACFSYKDINKVLFVTALTIDIDDMGYPVLYAEAFKGVRGAGPEGMDNRVLFNGKGKTMFEAITNMNATSSFKLNFTQNKVVIFTQKAAEYGLTDFIDFLDRDQEMLARPYIAVYPGDPEQLMKINITQDKYIGLFVTELIENIGSSSRAVVLHINDFYNQRFTGDKTNVVPIIDIPKDSLEAKLQIDGGAVIKDDKMVSIIEKNEGEGFNFLMNSVSSGTLEIANPCDINKFVTLEILKSKTKTEISYKNNIFHLSKKIKVKVDFGEAQNSIIFTKENIKKIQMKAEDNILKSCKILFAKYNVMGMDIFDITEQAYAKYPKIKTKKIINKTELKVDVEVEIMNTGDDRNFK